MKNTFYTHQTKPDVRLKVCPKTMRIEEKHFATGQWQRYRVVPLPLKPDHAKNVGEMYALPAEVVAHLTAVVK
jgi:hypothetical protein